MQFAEGLEKHVRTEGSINHDERERQNSGAQELQHKEESWTTTFLNEDTSAQPYHYLLPLTSLLLDSLSLCIPNIYMEKCLSGMSHSLWPYNGLSSWNSCKFEFAILVWLALRARPRIAYQSSKTMVCSAFDNETDNGTGKPSETWLPLLTKELYDRMHQHYLCIHMVSSVCTAVDNIALLPDIVQRKKTTQISVSSTEWISSACGYGSTRTTANYISWKIWNNNNLKTNKQVTRKIPVVENMVAHIRQFNLEIRSCHTEYNWTGWLKSKSACKEDPDTTHISQPKERVESSSAVDHLADSCCYQIKAVGPQH